MMNTYYMQRCLQQNPNGLRNTKRNYYKYFIDTWIGYCTKEFLSNVEDIAEY